MIDWDAEGAELFGATDQENVDEYRTRLLTKWNQKRGAIAHSNPSVYMPAATEVNSYIAGETNSLRKTGFANEAFYQEVVRITGLVEDAATPGVCECSVPDQRILNEIEASIGALRYDMGNGQ